jgi:hypothetical protein
MDAARASRKVYLGDSVYAVVDHGDLILTTEDGIRRHDTILLEPAVLQALLDYLRGSGVIR